MFKVMQKSACALAVLAVTATSAMATESVDVKVIGTVTPGACTPTISGGGVVDFGTIRANTLSADAYTVLSEKTLTFGISCSAPAKVAIKAVNDRPNTLAGATEGAGGAGRRPSGIDISAANAVGLGLDGTSKIGGYSVRVLTSTVLADNAAVDTIYRNSAINWDIDVDGDIYDTTSVRNVSWAEKGAVVPMAFTTLTGDIAVKPYLNKASELDLTHDIQLDGLTTIELVYL
ncbi:DUF1120 domain-containing protein [Dryocola clanedunensis]|uniref:DUF1120 domain-containing protein n=1 Tax=Cedecea sulfonylureivorans TaxID=3051154 RepID=UPI001F429DCA|nr:DUF1120 domain-containing protein [Cedecea sulfonylureivorans]